MYLDSISSSVHKFQCLLYQTCCVLIVDGFPSLFIYVLVWTQCLMHRCVCIWLYILQNYKYKLHFQNLSIYHIPHVSIEAFVPKKKEIAAAGGGWGVTEYLQLDWMGDGMDGWKKLHDHDVLYYMKIQVSVVCTKHLQFYFVWLKYRRRYSACWVGGPTQ